MEKDTVLLSVKKYNELRDFEKKIKEGKVCVISDSWGGFVFSGGYINKYYTNDEVVVDFEKRNSALVNEVEELKSQLDKKDKETTIEDVKRMNWNQFRKWKRG